MDDSDFTPASTSNAPPRKKPKRLQKYREEWEALNTWVEKVPDNIYKAHCTLCRRTFSIAHGGKSDLDQHASGGGHMKNMKDKQIRGTLDPFVLHQATPEADMGVSHRKTDEVVLGDSKMDILPSSPLSESKSDIVTICTSNFVQYPPSPSPSSDLSAICSATLENKPGLIVELKSPAFSGGQSASSRCVDPGPQPKRRKRTTEDWLLKTLEYLEKENASLRDTENTRFASVVADMLEKVPDHKKEAAKFKIYQLLYEAAQPDVL